MISWTEHVCNIFKQTFKWYLEQNMYGTSLNKTFKWYLEQNRYVTSLNKTFEWYLEQNRYGTSLNKTLKWLGPVLFIILLGPLLFIIYINDICNVSDLLYSILYADDSSILLNSKNIKNSMDLINNELQKLYIWLRANKLTLNIDKTYYMIFHTARI